MNTAPRERLEAERCLLANNRNPNACVQPLVNLAAVMGRNARTISILTQEEY